MARAQSCRAPRAFEVHLHGNLKLACQRRVGQQFTACLAITDGSSRVELLQDVGRRHADRLPGALAEESTWAAAQLGPYARMRVSLAVRRALARSLRDSACTEAQAALLRAAGGGGPPIDPRQTLDGGLGLPAEDDE